MQSVLSEKLMPKVFLIEALCFLVLENVGTFQVRYSRLYNGFTLIAWAVTTFEYQVSDDLQVQCETYRPTLLLYNAVAGRTA